MYLPLIALAPISFFYAYAMLAGVAENCWNSGRFEKHRALPYRPPRKKSHGQQPVHGLLLDAHRFSTMTPYRSTRAVRYASAESIVLLLCGCAAGLGCGSGGLGLASETSSETTSDASVTTEGLDPSTSVSGASNPDSSPSSSGSSGVATTTSGGSSDSSGTTGGRASSGASDESTADSTGDATTTGSTSDGGTSGLVPPDPVTPVNTFAEVEWVTPFAGRGGFPGKDSHVRVWNGAPVLVVHTAADDDLLVAGGLPSETTVESPGSMVALVRYDGDTGAVVTTDVLWQSTTPDIVSPFMSTLLTDVAIDSSGSLNVVGAWTGTTTFLPGTPEAMTRETLASSFIDPEGFELTDARYEAVVMHLEPDGSPGWTAVSDPPPGDPVAFLINYPTGVAVFDNGDPLVSGSFLGTGTSFPAGSPDAYVSEGLDSFFVRLNHDTGGPSWFGVGDTGTHSGLSDASGDALYIVLDGASGTSGDYFPGTPYAMTLPHGDHMTRLDQNDGVEWTVSQTHEEHGGYYGLVALDGEGVVGLGESGGGAVSLEGADGGTATIDVADVFSPRAQWVTRIDPQGSIVALQPFPETLRVGSQSLGGSYSAAMVAASDGVWYGGYVLDLSWFADDEIPELSLLTEAPVALIHVNMDGLVDETRVLGQGFDLESLAWTDESETSMLVSASYRLDQAQGLLAPDAAELLPLPLGLPTDGSSPEAGFVARINLSESGPELGL